MTETLNAVYQRRVLRPLKRIVLIFALISLVSSGVQVSLNITKSIADIRRALDDLGNQVIAEVLVGNEQTVPMLFARFTRTFTEVSSIDTQRTGSIQLYHHIGELANSEFSDLYARLSIVGGVVE